MNKIKTMITTVAMLATVSYAGQMCGTEVENKTCNPGGIIFSCKMPKCVDGTKKCRSTNSVSITCDHSSGWTCTTNVTNCETYGS